MENGLIALIFVAMFIIIWILIRVEGRKTLLCLVLGIPAFFIGWGLLHFGAVYWYVVWRLLVFLGFCLGIWLILIFGPGRFARTISLITGSKNYFNQDSP